MSSISFKLDVDPGSRKGECLVLDSQLNSVALRKPLSAEGGPFRRHQLR